MKNRLIKILLLFFALSFTAPEAPAQCAMCRLTTESNLRSGDTVARGINTGILYMLALPYLMVGTIGYIWWRNRKKDEDEVGEEG